MSHEQIEQLNMISSVLHVLSVAGESSTGIAYDIGRTCFMLETQLLDMIEEETKAGFT